jgi:pimeloyl-ACP methyl ester carboxylesterase
MPKLALDGAQIHWEEHGAGPETVVFSHGLLFSGRMFDAQVEALEGRYRCITFDFRGQGDSEVTASGYDMDTLTGDAAALIEALGLAPCHFAGLSMGGFVGMRLAIRRPELLRSLILLETSADPEPEENVGRYRLLNFIARWFRLRLVAGRVMRILFGRSFLGDPARREQRELWRRRLIANHRIGISRAVDGVIDRAGVYDQLDRIAVPTLVVEGGGDKLLPGGWASDIAGQIPGARSAIIDGAGHCPQIEQPQAVSDLLLSFFAEQS